MTRRVWRIPPGNRVIRANRCGLLRLPITSLSRPLTTWSASSGTKRRKAAGSTRAPATADAGRGVLAALQGTAAAPRGWHEPGDPEIARSRGVLEKRVPALEKQTRPSRRTEGPSAS
jgi:hypothetical protein